MAGEVADEIKVPFDHTAFNFFCSVLRREIFWQGKSGRTQSIDIFQQIPVLYRCTAFWCLSRTVVIRNICRGDHDYLWRLGETFI